MADFALPGVLDSFANLALASTIGDWISLGIYLIVSMLVSGIILVAILKILGSLWSEDYDLGKAFVVAIIITLINFFGMGYIGQYIPFIPPIIITAVIWVLLIKIFFSNMDWLKVIITAAVALALSIILAPLLSSMIVGMLAPLFSFGL